MFASSIAELRSGDLCRQADRKFAVIDDVIVYHDKMAAQVDLTLEGARADDTGERLEAGVFPTVCDQVR